ncbi:hypothetical protein ACS0TY_006620 [Phlomoides rotata]
MDHQAPPRPRARLCFRGALIARVKGTVWDLVPGIEQGMFPHQREGFKFIWRNIAGDIIIDNLKQDASSSRGCIISHAPGTGKTRLTIVFLQTFLKQYPGCCPMIIALKGMLLNWESEFSEWNFNVQFHNLNKELSGKENEVSVNIWKGVGAGMSTEATRILKLYSGPWMADNMLELFNTLTLVNPEFVKQIGCEDHFARKLNVADIDSFD